MPVSDPPAPSFPGMAQISGWTTVIVATLLLELTGSVGEEAVIAAVLDRFCAVAGAVVVIVIVATAPTASTPRVHTTGPVPVHVTPAGTAVEETKATAPGRVSVKVALVVAAGPRFCT